MKKKNFQNPLITLLPLFLKLSDVRRCPVSPAAAVAAVNTKAPRFILTERDALPREVVRIGMTDTVRAHPLHEAKVATPVQRCVAQWVIRWVVHAATSTDTRRNRMCLHEDAST